MTLDGSSTACIAADAADSLLRVQSYQMAVRVVRGGPTAETADARAGKPWTACMRKPNQSHGPAARLGTEAEEGRGGENKGVRSGRGDADMKARRS